MGYLGAYVLSKTRRPPLLPPPPPRRKLRRRPASRSLPEERAEVGGVKMDILQSRSGDIIPLSFLTFGDGMYGKEHADKSRTEELRCGGGGG